MLLKSITFFVASNLMIMVIARLLCSNPEVEVLAPAISTVPNVEVSFDVRLHFNRRSGRSVLRIFISMMESLRSSL
jgi:hypothetical protein